MFVSRLLIVRGGFVVFTVSGTVDTSSRKVYLFRKKIKTLPKQKYLKLVATNINTIIQDEDW